MRGKTALNRQMLPQEAPIAPEIAAVVFKIDLDRRLRDDKGESRKHLYCGNQMAMYKTVKNRASPGKDRILCDKYAEKQEGSDGWIRAQESWEIEGWARDVIGEMIGSIVAGRVDWFAGCKMGEMKVLSAGQRCSVA